MNGLVVNADGDFVAFMARGGVVVTPHDSTDIDYGNKRPQGLYIGTGGSVSVETLDGSSLTFVNVADGSFLPVLVKRVNADGTDASDIIALV